MSKVLEDQLAVGIRDQQDAAGNPPEDDLDAIEGESKSFADRLKRFVALEHRRRVLEADLEVVKEKASALAKLLYEDFVEQGTQNVNAGGLCVYLKTDRYVSKATGVETEQICEVLRDIGRGDLVGDGYNAASLKAWVLEQLSAKTELERQIQEFTDAQTLPPFDMLMQLAEVKRIDRLVPLLNIGSQTKVQTRKA